MAATFNSGPIPGENFTSDTKNYPWRQPPEFTDVDEALDWLGKKLTQFQVANGLLSMAEMGVPLYKIADMLLLQGMGEGKWTVDFMLILAGPVTRMIELICIGFGVEYDLGIYEEEDFDTGTYFKNKANLGTPGGPFKLLEEQLPEIKDEVTPGNDGSGEAKTETDLQQTGFMQMTQGGSASEQPKPQGGEGK